jgi:signal transduction histidine kinase
MLLALLASGRIADGAFTVLVILGVIALHSMTARTLATGFRMRAERKVLERRLHEANLSGDRDRIARELHDGVGADVTALLLRLRAHAKAGTNPKAAVFCERAQAILDDLRGVVWSLRSDPGTLGELGKLIDATCRHLREASGYERVMDHAQSQEPVGPEAALTTLALMRELSRGAAAGKGSGPLRVRLQLEGELVVDVEGGVYASADGAVSHLAAARQLLAEHAGTLTQTPSGICARIRLDA